MRIGGGRCDRGSVVGIVVGAGQLLSEEELPTRRAICGATDPVLCVLTDGFIGSWGCLVMAGGLPHGLPRQPAQI
jgi:hypothetical protein